MTPDEQRMIQDLFQRLASQGRVAKDGQADRVINDAMRANPDAAYMLVQTALVYEHQMNEQEMRIRDLEDQIAQMQRAPAPQAGGGSFLGGRIGAGRGTVPGVAAPAGSPWQQAQQPAAYQQPAPQRGGIFGVGQAPMAPQAAAPAGGGFLRSALTTAAGVAGGMMIANSLGGLFGGGHDAHAATNASNNNAALADADATQDALQDQTFDDQPQEAATDLSGWDDVET